MLLHPSHLSCFKIQTGFEESECIYIIPYSSLTAWCDTADSFAIQYIAKTDDHEDFSGLRNYLDTFQTKEGRFISLHHA